MCTESVSCVGAAPDGFPMRAPCGWPSWTLMPSCRTVPPSWLVASTASTRSPRAGTGPAKVKARTTVPLSLTMATSVISDAPEPAAGAVSPVPSAHPVWISPALGRAVGATAEPVSWPSWAAADPAVAPPHPATATASRQVRRSLVITGIEQLYQLSAFSADPTASRRESGAPASDRDRTAQSNVARGGLDPQIEGRSLFGGIRAVGVGHGVGRARGMVGDLEIGVGGSGDRAQVHGGQRAGVDADLDVARDR